MTIKLTSRNRISSDYQTYIQELHKRIANDESVSSKLDPINHIKKRNTIYSKTMRNVTTNKEEYHLQINQCSSVSPIPNDSYTIVCIQNNLQRNLSCRNVHYYIETMRNTIIPFPRNKFLTHSSNSSLYKQPNARLF